MIDWDSLELLADQQSADPAFRHLSRKFVPGEGPDNPVAFALGEAPGAQEEIQGRPFVGPAGIMLRRLISYAGISEESCWITNTVKFHPPRNRRPMPKEIEAARQYLKREWNAVGAPSLIIAVGGVALSALITKKMAITKVAGQCLQRTSHNGEWCYIWPMIHPSYGIRNEGMRPVLEQDWIKLGAWRELHSRAHRR